MPARKKVAETGDLYPLEKRWHISRGIPLGLIFSLFAFFIMQSAGVIWFFAHQDSRIDAVEKVQVLATQVGQKLQDGASQQGERMARLEEKVVSVQATANRIEVLLTSSKR
jgi:hypothetical protein